VQPRRLHERRCSFDFFVTIAQWTPVDDLSTTDGGCIRCSMHARTPHSDSVHETCTQSVVRPVVNNWIPAAAAHCQPVTHDPHQLNVIEVPDGRMKVAKDGDAVQR